MADLLPLPKWQFVDANGRPLAGGKVYTYAPGTTENKATYADAAQTVANANPVILDARGEAVIYWDGLYKIRVTDANDAQIYEQDDYGLSEAPASVFGANLIVNGDFEIDTNGDGQPDGWTITALGGAIIELSAANPYSGTTALRFSNTTALTNTGEAQSQLVPVAQGESLYLSAWLTCNNAALFNVVKVIWWSDESTALSVTEVYNDDGNTGTYENITGTVTVPAGAAFASVSLSGANTASGLSDLGTATFDHVAIERKVERAANADSADAVQGWAPGVGALAIVTTTQALSPPQALEFAPAIYDTNGFWSAGTPTRLTVPAGVNKVRLTGFARTQGGVPQGEWIEFFISKNGAGVNIGMTQSRVEAPPAGGSLGDTTHGLTSAVIEVSEGNYFEVKVAQSSVFAQDVVVGAFLCIEVVA